MRTNQQIKAIFGFSLIALMSTQVLTACNDRMVSLRARQYTADERAQWLREHPDYVNAHSDEASWLKAYDQRMSGKPVTNVTAPGDTSKNPDVSPDGTRASPTPNTPLFKSEQGAQSQEIVPPKSSAFTDAFKTYLSSKDSDASATILGIDASADKTSFTAMINFRFHEQNAALLINRRPIQFVNGDKSIVELSNLIVTKDIGKTDVSEDTAHEVSAMANCADEQCSSVDLIVSVKVAGTDGKDKFIHGAFEIQGDKVTRSNLNGDKVPKFVPPVNSKTPDGNGGVDTPKPPVGTPGSPNGNATAGGAAAPGGNAPAGSEFPTAPAPTQQKPSATGPDDFHAAPGTSGSTAPATQPAVKGAGVGNLWAPMADANMAAAAAAKNQQAANASATGPDDFHAAPGTSGSTAPATQPAVKGAGVGNLWAPMADANMAAAAAAKKQQAANASANSFAQMAEANKAAAAAAAQQQTTNPAASAVRDAGGPR